MDVINFLIDFLFYSFIDGLVLYLYSNNLKHKLDLNFKEVVINSLGISLILSLCSSCIKIVGITQICQAILVSLYLCIICKDDIKTAFKCGLISTTFICVLEFLYSILLTKYFNINVCSFNLDNKLRIISYLIFKIIEILIYIFWRCRLMKLVLGGVVRR